VNDVERLLAIKDCERLTYQYCRFADLGEAGRLGEVFTEDGLFETPGMSLRGRSEISRTFAHRAALTGLQTLHLCTNIDIQVLYDFTARRWVYLCLFRRWRATDSAEPVPITTPSLVAVYEDQYALANSRWLIESRVQHAVFADPDDTGWTPPPEPLTPHYA
jgi:hypothetical protein